MTRFYWELERAWLLLVLVTAALGVLLVVPRTISVWRRWRKLRSYRDGE